MIKRIYSRLLYIPIILLFGNLIFRLINQSKMLTVFPLDTVNDWSSYINLLFFLDKCGFHNFCPYWFNGFVSFQLTPPGWYFFTYPLVLIFKNYLTASYASMILIFILSFVAIYKFGGVNKIDKKNRILFFLLLFANAASIGNYVRLGRIPEFLSFLLFIIIAFIILYYKGKNLDWKILLIIPVYSLMLITHQTFAILASLLWISLFLIKDNKQRLIIIGVILSSLIIISFWFVPYLKYFFQSGGVANPIGINILSFDKQYLLESTASLIIPLVFLFIFYLYIKKSNYNKKEILFYLPIVIIIFLFLFRLTALIPILNYIYPDVYMGFIMFFVLFLFFKYFNWNKAYIFGIIFLSIISIIISLFYTPLFINHTQLEKNTLEIMKDIKTNFLMTRSYSETSYNKAYYSYAPIYFNISTPSGWEKVATPEHYNNLGIFSRSIYNKDCDKTYELANILKVDYVVSYNEDCNTLARCNLKKINQANNVCLYKFNDFLG